jgi:ABC-type taurine transport system substrate-binding protein
MSLTAKPIRAVKELEGKTIAVSTSSRPLILNLLRDAGVDPRSVNIVPSSPDPAALVSGQIDAIRAIPPIKVSSCKRAASTSLSSIVHDLGVPETAAHSTAGEDTSAPPTATSSSASCGRPSRAGVGLDHPGRTSPS